LDHKKSGPEVFHLAPDLAVFRKRKESLQADSTAKLATRWPNFEIQNLFWPLHSYRCPTPHIRHPNSSFSIYTQPEISLPTFVKPSVMLQNFLETKNLHESFILYLFLTLLTTNLHQELSPNSRKHTNIQLPP